MNLKIAVLVVTLFAASAPFAVAQVPQPGEPVEIKLGDNIELAEFVSISPVGVRVKLADGSMKILPATHVRRPPGAAARPAPRDAAQALDPRLRSQRKWTDSTGKFTVTATFSKLAGANVELKRSDGKTVSLPLDKLSPADRALAQSAALSGLTLNGVSPTTGRGFSSQAAPVPPEFQSRELPVPKPTDARLPPLLITGAAPEWKWLEKGAEEMRVDLDRRFSIPLITGVKDDGLIVEEELDLLIHVPGLNQFWATIRGKKPNSKIMWNRIARWNSSDGKELPLLWDGLPTRIVDVSPSGKFALAWADDFADRTSYRRFLVLYAVSGDALTPIKSYVPYADSGANSSQWRTISEAKFIDDNHLVTTSSYGGVVAWSLNDFLPVYRADAKPYRENFALSPSRKQLLLGDDKSVCVFNALTGKAEGRLVKPENLWGKPGWYFWRANGAEIAWISQTHLHIWDLKSGISSYSTEFDTKSKGLSLDWLPDNHLLLDKRSVVDRDRRLPICEIIGGQETIATMGETHFYKRKQGDNRESWYDIFPVELLNPALLERVDNLPEEQLLAIKPGERIRLDLDLPFDEASIAKIRESFSETIKANGWTLSDEGDVVLSVKVSDGKTYEVRYLVYPRIRDQVISVTGRLGEIVLRRGEKVLWSKSNNWSPPSNVFVKEGQTLEERLGEAYYPATFINVAIPRRILKTIPGGHLTSGTLSPTGVQITALP